MNQFVDSTFRLTAEHYVRVTKELRARGRRWASHRHGDLESAGASDGLLYRIYLNEQTAREHQVGPLKIIVAEVL
jgi:hypothetical protein